MQCSQMGVQSLAPSSKHAGASIRPLLLMKLQPAAGAAGQRSWTPALARDMETTALPLSRSSHAPEGPATLLSGSGAFPGSTFR